MKTSSTKSVARYKEYDICVITAANDYQAQGYREQLRWRIDKGLLAAGTEFLVFADPAGKRIGAGGSTIYVLYRLLKHLLSAGGERCQSPHELFKGKRILILHSKIDDQIRQLNFNMNELHNTKNLNIVKMMMAS